MPHAGRLLGWPVAREIAVSLVEERPGSAPLEHPRTVRTPLATVGRSVAALAEAARLALVNADPHVAEQVVQLISGLGQMLAEHEETMPAGQSVLLQQPLLARTHRILDGTARQIRGGEMRLPDDVRQTRRRLWLTPWPGPRGRPHPPRPVRRAGRRTGLRQRAQQDTPSAVPTGPMTRNSRTNLPGVIPPMVLP
jgi:hypothetical protein